MKVLVLSGSAWNNNNSFGISYSNLFSEMGNVEFANIYCDYGKPNNKLDMVFFQVTLKAVVQNLKNPNILTGKRVEQEASERSTLEQKSFDIARKLRWQVMFWARDFIWKIGRWKSEELKQFLDEFQPDLIFQPIYFSSYLNDIVSFIKDYTNAPMVGYISDDCYTLRQFRFSPLYWIDRLWKRQKVKRTIEQCEVLYVISQIQKEEYGKIFTPPCKILTKSADFGDEPLVWTEPLGTVELLYAGNLGAGRWKSLALIAEAVEQLNGEGYNVSLNIYSATPQTKAMQRKLSRPGTVLHGAVSFEEVQQFQNEADVLIHVEGLSLKSRMAVHQSFSTKLVDYFALGKCIFAVGTPDVASIQHLLSNDAAVVAEEADAVYKKLKGLLDRPALLKEYGQKAYLCGRNNHDKAKMQTMLMNDLKRVIEGYENPAD